MRAGLLQPLVSATWFRWSSRAAGCTTPHCWHFHMWRNKTSICSGNQLLFSPDVCGHLCCSQNTTALHFSLPWKYLPAPSSKILPCRFLPSHTRDETSSIKLCVHDQQLRFLRFSTTFLKISQNQNRDSHREALPEREQIFTFSFLNGWIPGGLLMSRCYSTWRHVINVEFFQQLRSFQLCTSIRFRIWTWTATEKIAAGHLLNTVLVTLL